MNPQEHEFEAAPGLPEALPPGERLLWQGSPDWRLLAVEALHVRKAAVYFAVLLAWRGADALAAGAAPLQALGTALQVLPLALAGLALLAGCAWLMARSTVYTLTDRRVVMRVGVALSVTFNLPFRVIGAAALCERGDGRGDISLALNGPDRIAYLHLWPHVRPWQLRRTQPMLRALPQARQVAQLLADALDRAAGRAGAPLAAPGATPPALPQAMPRARRAGRPMATA